MTEPTAEERLAHQVQQAERAAEHGGTPAAGDPHGHDHPASHGEHTSLGRVVRWDADDEQGAVVVDGLEAEIAVPPGVASALTAGELVEVRYEHVEHHWVAREVTPTDA
ncbi:MAG TPA: hypothetical protein VFS29_08345 [Motilibacteraceae bacterium]|nr:hypothetical protein [Motilibacteraceae bacterium]